MQHVIVWGVVVHGCGKGIVCHSGIRVLMWGSPGSFNRALDHSECLRRACKLL